MVDNVEEFRKRWGKLIEEIKKANFDGHQCKLIFLTFINEYNCFYVLSKTKSESVHAAYEILTELVIALQMAYSNYRSQNKGFWSKIFRHAFKLSFGDINLGNIK